MKRFGVIFVLFLLAGFTFVPKALAQTPGTLNLLNPSAQDVGNIADEAQKGLQTNRELYSLSFTPLAEASIVCQITGCNTTDPSHAFYYKKSALAMIGNTMSTIYGNPPADLALWFQDTGQTLGFLPKQAYAQGIGFTGLSPLLNVWKAFRNIAYMLIALGLVIVGFMVMFRRKIDPKTVITVQNSLPRIVVTLLLVTFSYAIAGFMIDLMYLSIALISTIMQSGFPNSRDLIINFTNGGFFALLAGIFAPISRLSPLSQVAPNVISGQLGVAFQNLIGGIAWSIAGGILLQAILAIAYLIAFIRIFFMLVMSYIQVLIAVIAGPLQILVDVFPGGNGFSSWMKGLLVNLVAFPVTVAGLVLANILYENTSGGNLWVPPLLPQPLGQINGQTIGGLGGLAITVISLGIVLFIPNIVNSIKEALKSKPLFSGGGFGPAGGIAMQGLQIGSIAFSHRVQKEQADALAALSKAVKGREGLTSATTNAIAPPQEPGR